MMNEVLETDIELRRKILTYIVESLGVPCSDGDMPEDRNRKLDQIIADHRIHQVKPFKDWYEDIGDVIWWKYPIKEGSYVGSPLDLGFQVAARLYDQFGNEIGVTHNNVGGWPFTEVDESSLYWQELYIPNIEFDFEDNP